MALGGGHQAIQDTAIGRTKYDAAKKMVMIEDIVRFPAECVNPQSCPTRYEPGARQAIPTRNEPEGA